MDKYLFPKKSELKQLNISAINVELPDLKNAELSKADTIAKWLGAWIKDSLESGAIEINNILPSKAELAYKLGVSIGTVQTALRTLEDLGYVESKQCIGTLVKDYKTAGNSTLRKLVSKRDLAVESIKRYIVSDGFKIGSRLPSVKTIATITGFTQNTIRMAMETLCNQNILKHSPKRGKENGFILISLDFDTISSNSTNAKTLVDMVVQDLENYIASNMKIGDRIPAHSELAKTLKASIKTVHDAIAVLKERGILLPRRGQYGTTVIKIPCGKLSAMKPETSIFAPAKDTAFYHYEKTQNHIKKMIAENYEIGDKLPSIQELSKHMDLSPNTIRKAFHNLAKEGYLVFSRGRYGGTFVIDIPETETQAFKWLAVNPAYAKEYSQQ